MLQLLSHARRGPHSAAKLSAAAALRAQARSLWTARSALSRVHAVSSLPAAAAPTAARAAAASSAARILPLHASSSRLPLQRGFATDAPEGELPVDDAPVDGEEGEGAAAAAASADDGVPSDEKDDGREPPNGPNIPLYGDYNIERNIDDLADNMAYQSFEEVNTGLEEDPDADAFEGGEQASYDYDLDQAERERVEAELSGVRAGLSEEEWEAAIEERMEAQAAEELEDMSAEDSGKELREAEAIDEPEREQETHRDPTHIVDNKWVFERQEMGRDGTLKTILVDKMGKKLRHMDDYVPQSGQDFASAYKGGTRARKGGCCDGCCGRRTCACRVSLCLCAYLCCGGCVLCVCFV